MMKSEVSQPEADKNDAVKRSPSPDPRAAGERTGRVDRVADTDEQRARLASLFAHLQHYRPSRATAPASAAPAPAAPAPAAQPIPTRAAPQPSSSAKVTASTAKRTTARRAKEQAARAAARKQHQAPTQAGSNMSLSTLTYNFVALLAQYGKTGAAHQRLCEQVVLLLNEIRREHLAEIQSNTSPQVKNPATQHARFVANLLKLMFATKLHLADYAKSDDTLKAPATQFRHALTHLIDGLALPTTRTGVKIGALVSNTQFEKSFRGEIGLYLEALRHTTERRGRIGRFFRSDEFSNAEYDIVNDTQTKSQTFFQENKQARDARHTRRTMQMSLGHGYYTTLKNTTLFYSANKYRNELNHIQQGLYPTAIRALNEAQSAYQDARTDNVESDTPAEMQATVQRNFGAIEALQTRLNHCRTELHGTKPEPFTVLQLGESARRSLSTLRKLTEQESGAQTHPQIQTPAARVSHLRFDDASNIHGQHKHLQHAKLQGLTLSNLEFSGNLLEHVDARQSTFNNCKFNQGCRLTGDYRGATFKNCHFDNIVMGANFRGATFIGCTFTRPQGHFPVEEGRVQTQTAFAQATFEACTLDFEHARVDSSLINTNLAEATLKSCVLRSDLATLNLTHATLLACQLSELHVGELNTSLLRVKDCTAPASIAKLIAKGAVFSGELVDAGDLIRPSTRRVHARRTLDVNAVHKSVIASNSDSDSSEEGWGWSAVDGSSTPITHDEGSDGEDDDKAGTDDIGEAIRLAELEADLEATPSSDEDSFVQSLETHLATQHAEAKADARKNVHEVPKAVILARTADLQPHIQTLMKAASACAASNERGDAKAHERGDLTRSTNLPLQALTYVISRVLEMIPRLVLRGQAHEGQKMNVRLAPHAAHILTDLLKLLLKGMQLPTVEISAASDKEIIAVPRVAFSQAMGFLTRQTQVVSNALKEEFQVAARVKRMPTDSKQQRDARAFAKERQQLRTGALADMLGNFPKVVQDISAAHASSQQLAVWRAQHRPETMETTAKHINIVDLLSQTQVTHIKRLYLALMPVSQCEFRISLASSEQTPQRGAESSAPMSATVYAPRGLFRAARVLMKMLADAKAKAAEAATVDTSGPASDIRGAQPSAERARLEM